MKDSIRTNIYLPTMLHQMVKDKDINLSEFVKDALDSMFSKEDPKYIESKMKDDEKVIKQKKDNINQYKKELEKINYKNQERKERLQRFKPQRAKTYRKIIPKGDGK